MNDVERNSNSNNSSRCISHLDSDENSRGSFKFRDQDIPFYNSFSGSPMVDFSHELVMNNLLLFSNLQNYKKNWCSNKRKVVACSEECSYFQPSIDKRDKIIFIDLGSGMQKEDNMWCVDVES